MTEFQLVNDNGSFHGSMWCIEVLDGPYHGLVFQYDTIKLVDENGNTPENEDVPEGDLFISFNTITIKNPNKIELKDDMSEEIFGEILNKLFKEELSRMTLIDEEYVEEIDEPESTGTEESDT